MEKNMDNKSCRLYGTPHCALLNQKSCESCRISGLSPQEQLMAAEDIYYMAEALPQDGLESIISSGHCALCRKKGREGEEANAASMFAQMDMGHLHPVAKIGDKLSGGYDRGTAMTIPVQLPVCESCRKKIGVKSILPLALGCLIALIGLLVSSLEPMRSALASRARILPFIVFLIFVFIGVIVESLVRRALGVKNERTINTRVKRIPALAPLLDKGWFAIGELNDGMPFVFTKKRLDSGILTGENQRELLDEIRAMGKEGIALQRTAKGEEEREKSEVKSEA